MRFEKNINPSLKTNIEKLFTQNDITNTMDTTIRNLNSDFKTYWITDPIKYATDQSKIRMVEKYIEAINTRDRNYIIKL